LLASSWPPGRSAWKRVLARRRQTPSAYGAIGNDPGGTLTPFQEDVAAPVAEGLSNREIAQRLALMPEAVSKEIGGLFRALRVISRVEIALWAIEHGSQH
jgi:DNA-binding NarL/FixJ family response regulator